MRRGRRETNRERYDCISKGVDSTSIESIAAKERLDSNHSVETLATIASDTSKGMSPAVLQTMHEEAYMMYSLSRSNQTYITRSVLPVLTPDGTIASIVAATDSDSSLQLSLPKLLHNIRTVVPRHVDTLAGSMSIYSVGDMIIPHHICGSIILQAACVTAEQLPSGTSATLGRAGLNATQLDTTRLGRAPPSMVPPPIFARDPPPVTAVFDYECKDRNGDWHSVCWDGTVDRRAGLRAFVLF